MHSRHCPDMVKPQAGSFASFLWLAPRLTSGLGQTMPWDQEARLFAKVFSIPSPPFKLPSVTGLDLPLCLAGAGHLPTGCLPQVAFPSSPLQAAGAAGCSLVSSVDPPQQEET